MFREYRHIFYWFIIIQTASALKDLPPNFPRCKRTDQYLEKCLLAATEQVRQFIKKGIPDFLPSVQNFTLPQLVMEQGNRAINYKARLDNVTLMGLENYKFTRYLLVADNMTFFIELDLPEMYLKGTYAIKGNLFFVPILGHGDFYVNISNTHCSIYHTVEIVKKNGTDYLKPLVTIPKIRVGNVTDYALEGLFAGNVELEKAADNVIKNNLDVIIEEILPAIEKVLGALFDQMIFKSVTEIPFDRLYPK